MYHLRIKTRADWRIYPSMTTQDGQKQRKKKTDTTQNVGKTLHKAYISYGTQYIIGFRQPAQLVTKCSIAI